MKALIALLILSISGTAAMAQYGNIYGETIQQQRAREDLEQRIRRIESQQLIGRVNRISRKWQEENGPGDPYGFN